MTPSDFWQRNLNALQQRSSQELSGLQDLLPLGPWPGPWVTDRDGRFLPPVPNKVPLTACFSTYDPVKEAQRWVEGIPEGSLVVWGGPSVQALQGLLQRSPPLLVIIEPRLDFWQASFSAADWTAILKHPSLFIPATPQELQTLLQNRHIPLWDRTLTSVEWRATADFDRQSWKEAWLKAQDSWKGDLSTQVRMGRLWMRQTLTNLARLKPFQSVWSPWDTVIVAGAGPGLETALKEPRHQKLLYQRPPSHRLFAVDTALPALISRGIEPDLIVSLDGQMVSYQHFLPSFPEHIPLLAELSSLPLLNRLKNPLLRFLGVHPLHRWIHSRYPELPQFSFPFGQVAGSALEAAYHWGAQKALLWGLDFAYPEGKTYARGTYVYPYFEQRAHRLRPLDSQLVAFAFRTQSLQRWKTSQGLSYTNPVLKGYREQLEMGVQSWTMNFDVWEGRGLELRLPKQNISHQKTPHLPISYTPSAERWKQFQTELQQVWTLLPTPTAQQTWRAYAQGLSSSQLEAWMTLWPLSAWTSEHSETQQELGTYPPRWQEIFLESRENALKILRNI